MVFQEEGAISWLWPLSCSLGLAGETKASCEMAALAAKARATEGSGPWAKCPSSAGKDVERAFDIAEAMEMGMARELVTDFVLPLRRSSRLWKFQVERGEDRRQYRLHGDDGAFLMYARVCVSSCRAEFFLYDPRQDAVLFDPNRPAFTMTWNASNTEWLLRQELPDALPPARGGFSGGQEVAFIRHTKQNIGSGVSWCMDVALPVEGGDGVLRLVTKLPEWSKDVDCLVLDFKGRRVQASAKNFQLAPAGKKDHVACQYGKLGPNTFSLDFRHPLTVAQAFGIALTTLLWT